MNARDTIKKAMAEWTAKNTPDELRAEVWRILDNRRADVIVKMAGFDNHWGDKWEVDHCNSRRSVIDAYMKDQAASAVNEWIASNIQRFPTMTPEMEKALIEEYKTAYEREIRDRICQLAEQTANEDVADLAERILSDLEIDEYSENADEEKIEFWT